MNSTTVRRVDVAPVLTDEQAADLGGTLLGRDDYNQLFTEDVDVYCQETGKPLAKFRKKVIPGKYVTDAFQALKTAAKPYTNRGISAGWDEDRVKDYVERSGGTGYRREENSVRFRIIRQDGTVSKTSYALPVHSGIIGYFDRNPRFPYCRQTAFNEQQFKKFVKAYPIIKTVDNLYRELMPEHYEKQRQAADESSQDFIIQDTAFSTVTVNMNWQTAVHQDAGDFRDGFGNLTAIRNGRYSGGYFVLPKCGIAFDLENQDCLMVNVHEWHGNTPIKEIDPYAQRMSLVMYLREKIKNCGTAEEELERIREKQQ